MLTRVEIDGFKSLRGVALDCEPLLGIIGANGAGKSNLFEALSILKAVGRL
jgi:AAA15 family ATPase/GTPase